MEKRFFYFVLISILLSFNAVLAWWNPNWIYRERMNISNKASADIEKGFTINYTLNTQDMILQNKMKSDCFDISIVKEDMLELDRLVSNCNEDDTTIQFKLLNSIHSYDDSYYIYYGNPNAHEKILNKSNIYYFYEGFRC